MNKLFFIFIFLVAIFNPITPTIRILYTAALLDHKYEFRKEEYIYSLNILASYGHTPYIVEACKIGDTFFDQYSSTVCYSQVNNLQLRNKGVNEVRSIQEAFKQFKFNENDIIIKLTGRYYFSSDYLIQLIKNNPDTDASVKLDSYGQVFGACYALRYKYFENMINNINLTTMEHKMVNIERIIANYIYSLEQKRVMYIDTIHVNGRVFGWGNISEMRHW